MVQNRATVNDGIMFDLWTVPVFDVFGWIFVKLRIEVVPFIICVPSARLQSFVS